MELHRRPFSFAILAIIVALAVAAGCGDDDDDTGAAGADDAGADAGTLDADTTDAAMDAANVDAGSVPSGGGGGGTGDAGGDGGTGGAGGTGGDGEDGEDGGLDEAPDGALASLEIVGNYVDNWDTRHEITDESWTQIMDSDTSVFLFSQFSNEDNYAIAQNHADNAYNAELWSRLEWTEHDGSLWYCQSVYDAETEQDALTAVAADASDPANGGCGDADFAWNEMTPE